jgi:uncharacterized protein
MSAQAQPVPAVGGPLQRAPQVDVLRALALLGVAVVNASYLGSIWTGPVPDSQAAAITDQVVRALVLLVFETKFYLLFSFLFGYAFALHTASAAAGGVTGGRFTAAYLRRLVGLGLLGIAHAVLLFPGDILTVYAVLGLVLLAARPIAPRGEVMAAAAVLAGAAAAFVVAAGLSATALGGLWLPVIDPAIVDAVEDPSVGGPWEVVAGHWRDWPEVLGGMWGLQGPGVLAMLLIGHAAGRVNLLQDPARLARHLPRIQRIGYAVGIPGALALTVAGLYTPGQPAELCALAINMATAPLLAAAMAATLLSYLTTRRAGAWLRTVAAAGRMTLTHYLGQSLIGALLYTGYGLDLGGNLPAGIVIAVAAIVFAAQVALSGRWLRHHAYGPTEWLLRAVTRWEIPPWRRTDATGA